ncbi:MAG: EAL domain-containing protein [Firmicutes bacterium]|nr:EAL domain-containing protein [Bacillota bacterium]
MKIEDEIIIKSKLLDGAHDIVLAHDLNGNILYINEAACREHGYTREELFNMKISDLDTPESAALIKERTNEVLRNGHAKFEVEHMRKDGTTFPIEVSVQLFEINGRTVCLAVNRVITERKLAEQKIFQMANYDSLTNLPNRRLFMDQIKKEIAKAKCNDNKLAVLFLDLDRFKLVNDTMGHNFGDILLQKIAKRLKGCLIEEEILARMGGDEFMILLPNILTPEDTYIVADKILKAMQGPIKIKDIELHSTISIGIAIYPEHGRDDDTILGNADAAMYCAKEYGGNRYHLYTSSINESVSRQLVLENNLRQALENDELVLYYQPQLNTETKQLVGVEALIRWIHPEYGIIPPGEFITFAESTGIIINIGEWVLRTACKQMNEWLNRGYQPFRMSVNISVKQLQQYDFAKVVYNILEETELDPKYLELEITETVFMQRSDYLLKTLKDLKEIGIRITLDDFGVEYSSLNYLKKFPIDALKIDRSFIKDISIDPDDTAITSAAIALAKKLSLNVVAEGVETEDQFDFLLEQKCNEVQGFLFGKPVPVEQAELLLKKVKGLD